MIITRFMALKPTTKFTLLIFLLIAVAICYPAFQEKKYYKTEEEWINKILKEAGMKRDIGKKYELTLTKSAGKENWYDFNLEIQGDLK